MPWLRVDDRMYTNRKVMAASSDGKLLWLWAMDYSADQLTDGILRPHEVQMLGAMLGLTDWRGIADGLIELGLFERQGDNYIIHDYLKYNPTKEQVIADREANATRQAEFQAKKRREQATGNEDTNAVNNGVSNGVSKHVPYPYPYPYPNPVPTKEELLPSHDGDAVLAPELAQTLRMVGAKRFKSTGQRDAYAALLAEVGSDSYLRAVKWGVSKGFGLSEFPAIATCARKPPPRTNGVARASPDETYPERCIRLLGSFGRDTPEYLMAAVKAGKPDAEILAMVGGATDD